MGWFRTIKSAFHFVAQKIYNVPTRIKKKVLRSKPIRSLLASQLGKILTSIVETHVLAATCILFKWTCWTGLVATTTHNQTLHTLDTVQSWAIDIFVPVVFALKCHDSFYQLIVWTFERPLQSLARRIQYMRPNDPFHFLKIKYSLMIPIFSYVGGLFWISPISSSFVHICLVQTLIIQSLTDFWPLRQQLTVYQIVENKYNVPTKIKELEMTQQPEEVSDSSIFQGRVPIHHPHFKIATVDPFAQVQFKQKNN